MNPDELLDQLLNALQSYLESGGELDEELASEFNRQIEGLVGEIESAGERGIPPSPPEPPITGGAPQRPQGVELLWILSGGNEEAFINYLRTMPVPQANELLQNPARLQETIDGLSEMMPRGFLENQAQDGIPHAPLQSSNVYGYLYDPKSQELMVRFNSGSVYRYHNVPPSIYNTFTKFMVPAKTNGQNSFGRWWVGKTPSVGSSMFALIKNGGFAYDRVA